MIPIFNKVAQAFVDEVVFVKVNVEKNSVLAQKNKVSGVPTFIIFKNGQPVKRFSGTRGDNRLKQEINEVMD